MKINGTLILKIVGLALNIGGMIVGGIATDRSNKKVLADLVKNTTEM